MAPMEGKVALVTGAASGIGRASALALAEAGAAVCVSDINGAGAEETAHRIIDMGGKAIAVSCDVTKAEDVKTMVAATVDAFGQLDAAVNNAGIAGSFTDRLHEADDAMFEQVLAVNLRGVWLCMKAELAQMLSAGDGSIVNIASVAGLIGAPKAAAYTASKHAVVGLTKSAAVDYAKLGSAHQRHLPGLYRHGHGAERDRRQSADGAYHGAGDPDGAIGSADRNRRGCRVALLGRVILRHRARAGAGWRLGGAVGFRYSLTAFVQIVYLD